MSLKESFILSKDMEPLIYIMIITFLSICLYRIIRKKTKDRTNELYKFLWKNNKSIQSEKELQEVLDQFKGQYNPDDDGLQLVLRVIRSKY